MSLTELLKQYGLWTVLLGTFFEGEGVMLMAGGLAHQQILSPLGSWLVGALGAYVGHLVYYGLGRYLKAKGLFARVPRWKPKIERALPLIRKYPKLSIFIMQYLYGMRIVGAVAMGLSGMAWSTFMSIELINCLIWSGVILMIGYSATAAVLAWLPLAEKSLTGIFIAVLLAMGMLYLLVGRGVRWKEKSDLDG
ncbi:MAG: DedA family protein [Candidatus Manganitrophus sp. SB1]|jgi:membrane protein DedA with SNARE-associated domain|nr:DedA family protein [Candidatus Manganitrophus morganii]